MHIAAKYKTGRPRLPQLAIYAIYQCTVSSMQRYEGCLLDPLARMKSADRKAGTVGDVVVSHNGIPIEAVETKLDEAVSLQHLADAIDKISSAAVRRYFILSTANVNETDRESIDRIRLEFRRSNGCEIVVNGVQETIRYYLRLLPDPTDFVLRYAALIEVDPDLDYEHRISWNKLCTML
jgi:DNA (cytosine-5)-methyltransferase 1